MPSPFFTIRSLNKDTFAFILPKFLSEMTSDFKLLSESISKSQFTLSKKIAHKMKGTSHVYGAGSIVHILDNLEKTLNLDNNREIDTDLLRLKKEIDQAYKSAETDFSIKRKQ